MGGVFTRNVNLKYFLFPPADNVLRIACYVKILDNTQHVIGGNKMTTCKNILQRNGLLII